MAACPISVPQLNCTRTDEVVQLALRELKDLPNELIDDDADRLHQRQASVIRYLVEPSDEWVIPGLLARLDRVMITGWEGLAKSTLLRQVAYCAAAGINPFNGARVSDGVRVLMVDAENSSRQSARALRWIAAQFAAGLVGPSSRGIGLACWFWLQ